jgi:hypothetical protein
MLKPSLRPSQRQFQTPLNVTALAKRAVRRRTHHHSAPAEEGLGAFGARRKAPESEHTAEIFECPLSASRPNLPNLEAFAPRRWRQSVTGAWRVAA